MEKVNWWLTYSFFLSEWERGLHDHVIRSGKYFYRDTTRCAIILQLSFTVKWQIQLRIRLCTQRTQLSLTSLDAGKHISARQVNRMSTYHTHTRTWRWWIIHIRRDNTMENEMRRTRVCIAVAVETWRTYFYFVFTHKFKYLYQE